MVSLCRQILGVTLAVFGFLATILICALPMWKVTAFIGANIVTAQIIWEGLWMTCVIQSTGQMQCKIYDSLLALPRDLQAARALVVISIVVSVFGILLSTCGGKCTNFVEDESRKIKIAIASGVTFIVAGVLCLIPVCWSANTIIQDFYNPVLTSAQKREIGASLYIGWGAAALLILGGALLCSSCPPQEDDHKPVYKYSQAQSVATSRAYRSKGAEYCQYLNTACQAMASFGLQFLGCILSLIGFVGVVLICGLPMWRVSAFIGSNIVTAQIYWEGIWMSCIYQSTGQLQCEPYFSMLALTSDLQAARALVVVSLVVGIIGLILAFISGKRTNFIPEENRKKRIAIGAGAVLIISGILCLIPVSWTASVIIQNFYNPTLLDAQKYELGASLYIGWGASLLLIIGGGLLCSTCPEDDRAPSLYHPVTKSRNDSLPSQKAPAPLSYAPSSRTYI
ncbi:uncharacterized protein [Hoplias malabaricus]|uniref:uncharacterized protein n=1 Tax=Hoplias malabaricus TaxID=27720 RepID=UPI0034620DE6